MESDTRPTVSLYAYLVSLYLFVHTLNRLLFLIIVAIFIMHYFWISSFYMIEQDYDAIKESVLAHMQALFEEMEEEMAVSHQEKYALLEDAFENATDIDELRVAFEQWYAEHAEELELEHEADELWDMAMSSHD